MQTLQVTDPAAVTGMKLKPVPSNFTLTDHIYDTVRNAVLEMNIYHPDTDLRLDERSMAEQLGISRTPLREALVRLEQDGFVEIRSRKGVFIRRRSLTEVLEMIEVWAALESMAARLASERATNDELASLRRLGAEYSENEARADIAEYSEQNIKFHQRILELSHNAMLKDSADNLFMQMRAVRRRAMGESNRARRSVVDHMGIIEAFESRDPALVSERVREHTMRLHEHVWHTWSRLETRSKLRAESA